MPYFISMNDQMFGSSAVSIFWKFGEKSSFDTGVSHDVYCWAREAWYCTCAV